MFAVTQRNTRTFGIFTLLFFCSSLPLFAQDNPSSQSDVVVRSTFGSDRMVMLPVAGGALLVEGEDEARVTRHIAAGGSSADAPKFQTGDLIIYLNGERIKSASQLNKLYLGIAVGDEVKMGVQRGDNKMIKTFVKPEPQTRYESGDGTQVVSLQTSNLDAGNMQNMENPSLWRAGFLVGEDDGRVVIGSVLPLPGKIDALSDLKPGDEIMEINGTKITSARHVEKVYETINQGDDVTVAYKNADGVEEVMFKKPATPNMQMSFDHQPRVNKQ